MPLRNGKSKWRLSEIKKYKRGWWLVRERNILLNREFPCLLKSRREEISIKKTILVDIPKYLCWVRLNLINIKSSMTSLWNSIILQPSYRTTLLWCLEILIKKSLLTITTSNQRPNRKPKNTKKRIWKTTQGRWMSLNKIRFWVVQVKTTWISTVQV